MSSSPLQPELIAKRARQAAGCLSTATGTDKSKVLLTLADLLVERRETILEANRKDTEAAEEAVAAGRLSASLAKRLDLSGTKFDAMVAGVRDVEKLDDPTDKVILAKKLDEGLDLYRVTCPVGVMLVIFEARPEVVINIAALAIKSGNAAILKGGKEAAYTNAALHAVLRETLIRVSLPSIHPDTILSAETREQISALLHMDREIDLVIPRGSADLVRHIKKNTSIPVLGHADGLCSVYVDEGADVDIATKVVYDSKTSYPAACNSAETLLIHRSTLATHLPAIAKVLQEGGVMLRCDAESLAVLPPSDKVQSSKPEDYDTEFLDLTIAVKTVGSMEEACAHVTEHGSRHTEVIITNSQERYDQYARRIDAAGVYLNASSRFADGFRYGFGAEVGVSTNKTHARGPVGLEGLVIYKYRLYGQGHVSKDYLGAGGQKKYLHENLLQSDVCPVSFQII